MMFFLCDVYKTKTNFSIHTRYIIIIISQISESVNDSSASASIYKIKFYAVHALS